MNQLEPRLQKHVNLLMQRYPMLEKNKQDIICAYFIMEECYKQDLSVKNLQEN